MFNNGNIAIIDIGSDKIYVKIGIIAKDNIFHIKSSAEIYYDGFMDGDWLQGDDVSKVVTKCLDKALYDIDCKISAIYVGVPGAFSRVQVCSNKMNFGCSHRISSTDVQAIQENTTPKNDGRFEVIDCSVINFILDSKEKTLDPIGKNCFNLGVNLSYSLCKKAFCDLFRTILEDYARKVKFVNSQLAESLLATNKEIRMKNSAVLVDIGYLTTDVSYIMGGGLIALDTISLGGGHIAYDLSYGAKVDYNTACYLKGKIDFNDNDGNISVRTNKGVQELEKSYINMIASARLEEIAEKINKIIADYRIEYPKYLKVYLTGRGISDMKGVRSIVSNVLQRQCEIINSVANNDERNRVYLSTASIMQYICEKDKPFKSNLISKLFGWDIINNKLLSVWYTPWL